MAASVAWLAEEVGELSRAVRKGSADEQLHELGDVLAWLTSLAGQLGLSLEDAAARYTDRRHHPVVGFMTIWDDVLDALRSKMPTEDFRRWFGATAYASDSTDQITVWVPSEAIRRHIERQFQGHIDRALVAMGRAGTHIRFVVAGLGEDDEDEQRRP